MGSYDLKKELYKGDRVTFKSIYKNLGVFYKSVISSGGGDPADTTISYPELVQVCYGGVFAASYLNIKMVDHSTWKRIEEALSRGNNVEEGHFMERSWGSLLATPLQHFQVEALLNYTQLFGKGFSGALKIPRRKRRSGRRA